MKIKRYVVEIVVENKNSTTGEYLDSEWQKYIELVMVEKNVQINYPSTIAFKNVYKIYFVGTEADLHRLQFELIEKYGVIHGRAYESVW